jgi:gamma-glutamyl:cysteine ligase YbdK (ATP-grasp superfamily)
LGRGRQRLYELPADSGNLGRVQPTRKRPKWILKKNRWRAKRFGIHAAFIVEGFAPPFSAEQWLFLAEQMLGDAARKCALKTSFLNLAESSGTEPVQSGSGTSSNEPYAVERMLLQRYLKS